MKRIVIHWTAGGGMPNDTDKEHYHYLVDIGGRFYCGKFKPEDNLVCKNDKTGKPMYACHTGGGNTGSIGVAFCGMRNFKNRENIGDCPITRIQFETVMQLCAEICKKYHITVTPQTVMTHYEFGKSHPKSSSAGKIDIVYLPPFSYVKQSDVGEFVRNKIRWYVNHPENRKTLLE